LENSTASWSVTDLVWKKLMISETAYWRKGHVRFSVYTNLMRVNGENSFWIMHTASYTLTSWYTTSTGSKLTATPKSASQFNGCFSKSTARKLDDVLPVIRNYILDFFKIGIWTESL
jgi:hypothetical protein